MVVRLKERDHARRCSVHERLGRRRRRSGGLEIRDVGLHRFEALDADLADAAWPAVFRGRARVGELPEQPGEFDQVLAGLARGVAIEAGDAVLDVGRVADLAHLAVADDVDADLDLAAHDVGDRVADRARAAGAVMRRSLVTREQDVRDRLRARQAADVRRQDPVGARAHGAPIDRCCSRCGPRPASA